MAWPTMHFAIGMSCAGALAGTGCLIFRRGWRWIPVAMTLGGIWACVPDVPRFFREDFPNLPFGATLGRKSIEDGLHRWGDLFFFHAALDAQPYELALFGLGMVLLLYNAAIVLLLWLEHRARHDLAARTRALHRSARRSLRHQHGSSHHSHHHHGHHSSAPPASAPDMRSAVDGELEEAVLQRIGPGAAKPQPAHRA